MLMSEVANMALHFCQNCQRIQYREFRRLDCRDALRRGDRRCCWSAMDVQRMSGIRHGYGIAVAGAVES